MALSMQESKCCLYKLMEVAVHYSQYWKWRDDAEPHKYFFLSSVILRLIVMRRFHFCEAETASIEASEFQDYAKNVKEYFESF